MRRVARPLSSVACKRGDAVRLADGYGRVLRLTIEFRYFECGRNTETPRGRSCLTFGARLTCRSSIVTRTSQNLPLRHAIDALHTPSKLS
jgi:hypothetical protein